MVEFSLGVVGKVAAISLAIGADGRNIGPIVFTYGWLLIPGLKDLAKIGHI